jgi:hypothetical protein
MRPTRDERFDRRYQETAGCWLWTGTQGRKGYGIFHFTRRQRVYAHRYALERKLGRPLEHGKNACHTCDVRLCVNPEHLYEGTPKQNTRDAIVRGRFVMPPVHLGERNRESKLTESQIIYLREAVGAGASARSLALAAGLNPSTVQRIVSGKAWKHVPSSRPPQPEPHPADRQ